MRKLTKLKPIIVVTVTAITNLLAENQRPQGIQWNFQCLSCRASDSTKNDKTQEHNNRMIASDRKQLT